MIKTKKKIPFEFVLEDLISLDPFTRPMFGCHAVYIGEKIMLILRERPEHREDNGVWVATSHEHHQSLKKEIPNLRTVNLLNNGQRETAWRLVPLDADDFESSVSHVCSLILKRDPRIGKVPKSRKKKS
ncbi:MAG TPA: hypothetical protein VI112_11085 [Bacteroidia bacterium]|jgi:hypothetical protein